MTTVDESMPRITLPDGSVREFDHPVTAREVAEAIGPGLAASAIGARINGELCDLDTRIENDAEVALITARKGEKESDPDAMYLIRHSCAHVMAEAIQRLWPGVELVYGPPVDNGFYYDMALPEGVSISSEDFDRIEAEMAKIIEEDRPFTRYELSPDEGMRKLEAEGNKYKIDNARRALDASQRDPEDMHSSNGEAQAAASLSFYATGEPGKDWEDLCRGPHVPSTSRIGAFKVMSLASSYWHGDATSDRLLRVYGTAFVHKKQLKQYLNQLEEAKKRDHRVIGKQLQLFHTDDAVGQGLILWTPNGSVLRNELGNFIAEELRKQGYHQVFTPHLGKLELYKTSGHFPYYRESQFPPLIDHDQMQELAKEGVSCSELANRLRDGDIEGYLLKPMNCPHHIKIFAGQQHSYRDLPVRLAEFGTVYRWEQSGEVGGMTRVRGFTQDDAHIFCTEDQVAQELNGCLELVKVVFRTLEMTDFRVRVGLRDPDSSKYVGDPSNWDKAEAACRQAAETLGAPFAEEPGEAAFYGPKIDFVVTDVIGREWQTGTVQVDYNLPERFDLSYIGPDNKPHRPVMIHRAPFGSFERFIGVLIEHFGGAFPTWLAPEQVRVLPISEKTNAYSQDVLHQLRSVKVRATLDDSGERIQAKIRSAADMRIPYLLILGPKEAEAETVSVRARGIEKDLGTLPLQDFVQALQDEIATKGEQTVVRRHFDSGR